MNVFDSLMFDLIVKNIYLLSEGGPFFNSLIYVELSITGLLIHYLNPSAGHSLPLHNCGNSIIMLMSPRHRRTDVRVSWFALDGANVCR